MNHALAGTTGLTQEYRTFPPLEPADASLLADEMRYCPTQLLSAFALLMAGHGRAVCTSMMLGDRGYAMLQLARAHTISDPQLRGVTARLFAYFDDMHAPAPGTPRRSERPARVASHGARSAGCSAFPSNSCTADSAES